MGNKFKVPVPKTLTDKSVATAIAAYEKLPDDKYGDRVKALNAVIAAANKLKPTQKLPDVAKYLVDVAKAAETERKLVETALAAAKKKAFDDGGDDGAARKQNRAPQYAKSPEVMKAYVDGYAYGVKIPPKQTMKAR